jgi:peptide deformylase
MLSDTMITNVNMPKLKVFKEEDIDSEFLKSDNNSDIPSDKVSAFTPIFEQMIKTCYSGEGAIGLAAPQVGIRYKFFVMKNIGVDGSWYVVVNPKILEVSDCTEISTEGCLSVTESKRIPVERPIEIKVSFLDESGIEQFHTFNDYQARVFLHEYDHLYGKLISRFIKREVKVCPYCKKEHFNPKGFCSKECFQNMRKVLKNEN